MQWYVVREANEVFAVELGPRVPGMNARPRASKNN